MLLLGDLNGRTGSQTPSVHDPFRVSKDINFLSARGNFLFRLCVDYDMVFISGAACFGPASGAYTSFQGARKTVIDYAICSRTLFPKVQSFKVEPQVPGFDHAPLILELEVDPTTLGMSATAPRKRKREIPTLPDDTELDRLLIKTLEAGKDESKKALSLFGPVLSVTVPTTVCNHLWFLQKLGQAHSSSRRGDILWP
jgi:hypothetical protein